MFFWKREKRDTKRIQAVSPWRILFGKGKEMKRMNSPSFQGLENQNPLGKLLAQRRRSSKRFKTCKGLYKIDWIVIKCKTKPCFYRLFMSGQEDHLKELLLLEKLKTNLKKSKTI